MTLEEFVLEYNNKTVGSGQCVALVVQYMKDVQGFTNQFSGNAHDFYDNFESSDFLKEHYNRIPKGDSLPHKGDIVVWSTAVGRRLWSYCNSFWNNFLWSFYKF